MSYYTHEKVIDTRRGWKRPLYSYERVYRTKEQVMRRIRGLIYEYGDENIVHMPDKHDPRTEIVYVRVN